MEAIDSATAVKLSAEDLVCLDETLKLSSKVGVLALEAASVLLEGLSLSEEVTVVVSVLLLCNTEALNITSDGEESVLTLLKSHLRVTDLDGDVGVAALLEVNLLSKVVVLSSNSLVVSAESSVLRAELGVVVSDAAELTLSVLESELLVAEVGGAAVEELLGVLDAGLGASKLEVKALKLVSLLGGLGGTSLIHLLQTGKLSPHLGSLDLDALDFSLEVLELSSGVVVLIALGDGFLTKAASFEVLLIEESLGAGKLVVEVKVLLGPITIEISK